ncbi:AAA family ATPase [Brevundimonas sp.]|uniref:AAA family ATPase n=1 Tax=Brevundimonas sp. TaxID=1871086 RepID=UPI0028AC88F4|nr:AAA family ATPase [Brevundimonas sp.]
MTPILLDKLEITNFRSIRGTLTAPLGASTVLIHGENGAGKTSLLSAIELSLRGGIEFLELADKDYRRQLLHHGSGAGRVLLETLGLEQANRFETTIGPQGATTVSKLGDDLSRFFKERCYLPQSLLNQLLKMYQDSGADADSPLAAFVSELLGLKRLDAIELGLAPADDIRNLRKAAGRLAQFEGEKSRLDRDIASHRKSLDAMSNTLADAVTRLNQLVAPIGVRIEAPLDDIERYRRLLAEKSEGEATTKAHDQRTELQSILRHLNQGDAVPSEEADLAQSHEAAAKALAVWDAAHRQGADELFARVSKVLPQSSWSRAFTEFFEPALRELGALEQSGLTRLAQATTDVARRDKIAEERQVAKGNLETIEEELGKLSADSASLGAALAEIAAFIVDDVCPVCERDFSETERGSLAAHVNDHVRRLSASAQRLLDLGSAKSSQQTLLTRLEQEAVALRSRTPDDIDLADLTREAGVVTRLISDLKTFGPLLAEGERLREAETAARRRLSQTQALNLARSSALSTLSELALSMGETRASETETVTAMAERLSQVLNDRIEALATREAIRRRALESLDSLEREVVSQRGVEEELSRLDVDLVRIQDALARSAASRQSAQTIKTAVKEVRSDIVRHEFNERLNKLWRDLFVRLAPNEPFVPAFKIPEIAGQQLQPKLITQHRLGGAGGTPGAMLSAGNLNTAALTLFIALHLTMKPELPWLILDDPVQSMDDVHIAHFAALLRTLSKEHGRQVIIAVHDRQLFEYLRLELSPAFPTDTLQTLELVRGAQRDTICLPHRYDFREETALQAA